MMIVQGDEQAVHASRTHRGGEIRKQHLLRGEDLGRGNFFFSLAYQKGDFYSPRHRHNFDQFRYQIDGECSFGQNGVMRAGTLGYFTEGSYYGPQTSDAPNLVAVVQFSGPSGNGYMTQSARRQALDEMASLGRFEKGVFYRNDGVPGKRTLDSYQATWEHAMGRRMVYPKPQYADAIMMETPNYRWMPLDGATGVEEKAFGTFTDCRIRAASYKLDPGATLEASGRGIFFVLAGAGSLEGGAFRRYTSLYLDGGERAAFRAVETSEILLLGLPDVGRMRAPMPELDAAEDEEPAGV